MIRLQSRRAGPDGSAAAEAMSYLPILLLSWNAHGPGEQACLGPISRFASASGSS